MVTMDPSFEELREMIIEANPDAIFYDGLEDALIGICRRFGMPPVALYDYNKCIDAIMRDDCNADDAIEYLEFNTLGLWAGDNTPAFFCGYR